MTKQQIEFRTLQVLERISAGQPLEDSSFELKRQWPQDFSKAARQIAAHANAARGEPIIWLIGVDEKQGVIGADYAELSNWFSSICSWFDDNIYPSLVDINIPYNSLTVVALQFDTDRSPYVVKIPDGGPFRFDVPWREGTSTRSVKRSDLLRLLVPTQRVPDVDLLDATLSLEEVHDEQEPWLWQIQMELYITPRNKERIVIPFHKCECKLTIAEQPSPFPMGIRLTPKDKAHTTKGTYTELMINDPGAVIFSADLFTVPLSMNLDAEQQVELKLKPSGSDLNVGLTASFVRDKNYVSHSTPGSVDFSWKLKR